MTQFTRTTLAVVVLVVMAGCGLTLSDEERLQRADEQIASGAYRAAIIEIKNVLASDSENVRARLMLAEVSLGLGDIATAEKELSRAAAYGASESDVRLLNLAILAAKNSHAEVLAALGMDTGGLSEADVFAYRAQALLGLGNIETAEETYREWLVLDPESSDAQTGLAKCAAATGNLVEAIEKLQLIVAADPQHVDALHFLGLVYARVGNYADSETTLIAAIENSEAQKNIRRHVLIIGSIVASQLAQSKTEEARDSLNRLSAIVPNAPITLILSARLARMEQDYALAARHLQTLLNIDPKNQQAQLSLANVQLMQGNYAQAEMLLNRLVARSPDNVQARKLLAQAQVRQDQTLGAIEVLAPLIENSEADADVYNLLAQIGYQSGDTRSVIQNLRAAAESSPGDMEIRQNLVAAYLNIGEHKLAAEALTAVPETSADDFRRQQLQLSVYRAQNNVADANKYAAMLLGQYSDEPTVALIVSSHYEYLNQSDLAKQVLVDFTAGHRDDVRTSIALGRLEISNANVEVAKKLFAAVLAKDAGNLDALLGLARVAEIVGDDAKALSILQTAAAKHTKALAPRVWLANHYLQSDLIRKAENQANEIIAIGFRNANVSEIVGRVLLEVDRLDEAVVQFEIAARLDPGSANIQIGAARAYLASARTVEARGSLGKALQLRPDWVPAKSLLALVSLRQGQADEAQRLVAELRSDNPNNVSIMVLEGEVLLYGQDFRGAAAAFGRAVRQGAGRRAMLREFQSRVNGQLPDPAAVLHSWLSTNAEDAIARTTLAQYYLQTNAGDKAIQEFETVLKSQPENAPVLNNLAWQYQQLGQLDKALETAERAYSIDNQSGAIADTLGWIYRDLGQLDKSLKLLSDASRLAPDNGEIQYHLAAVLADTNNEEQARRILDELMSGNSQFPSRGLAKSLLDRL